MRYRAAHLEGMNVRNYETLERLAWVLLPSFLFAAAADIVFFELCDPVHLPFTRDPLGTSRIVAFVELLLSLWILAAAAIAFTFAVRRTGDGHHYNDPGSRSPEWCQTARAREGCLPFT
jgi:hypothetical protein